MSSWGACFAGGPLEWPCTQGLRRLLFNRRNASRGFRGPTFPVVPRTGGVKPRPDGQGWVSGPRLAQEVGLSWFEEPSVWLGLKGNQQNNHPFWGPPEDTPEWNPPCNLDRIEQSSCGPHRPGLPATEAEANVHILPIPKITRTSPSVSFSKATPFWVWFKGSPTGRTPFFWGPTLNQTDLV